MARSMFVSRVQSTVRTKANIVAKSLGHAMHELAYPLSRRRFNWL
jgi:hypothetical protein